MLRGTNVNFHEPDEAWNMLKSRSGGEGVEKACRFVLKWGLVILLGVSPLPFGSVLPGAYVTIEVVSLFLLSTWFFKCVWSGNLEFARLTFLIPIGCFVLIVIFQLIPITETFVSWISPARQKIYHLTLSEKQKLETNSGIQPSNNANLQLSVYRHATSVELLKILSYLLIFLVTINNFNTREDTLFFLRVLVIFGFGYSLFAIIQKISWNGSAYWFIPMKLRRFPYGPYINKNHFAGYIGMLIPLALSMLATKKMDIKNIYRRNEEWTFSNFEMSNTDMSRDLTVLFVSLVMILALFMSLSRGGIFSSGVALIFLVVYASSIRKLRKKIWVVAGIVVLSVPLMALLLDFRGVIGRLESLNIEKILLTEGRFRLWGNATEILQDYPFLGVGLGAFSSIYTSYQAVEPKTLYTHLENDYFQLLIETGVVGGIAVFFAIVLFVKFVLKRFFNATDSETKGWMAGGIGAGISIGLHSFIDFNLHIPANAVLFSFVMALLTIMTGLRKERDRYICSLEIFSLRLPRWNRKWLAGLVVIGCGLLVFGILNLNHSEEKKLIGRGKSFLLFVQLGHRTNRCEFMEHGQKALEKFQAASRINPLNSEYHYYIGLTKGVMTLYKNKCRARTTGGALLDYNSSFRTALYLDRVNPSLKFNVSMFYLSFWQNLPKADREYGIRVFKDALMIHPDFKYKAREILLKSKKKNIDPAIMRLL